MPALRARRAAFAQVGTETHKANGMLPSDLRKARQRLGLSLAEMARMLGYEGSQIKATAHRLETGERPLREPQRRLIEAYLSGYRPTDWPA